MPCPAQLYRPQPDHGLSDWHRPNSANASYSNLTDADLSQTNLANAEFGAATLTAQTSVKRT